MVWAFDADLMEESDCASSSSHERNAAGLAARSEHSAARATKQSDYAGRPLVYNGADPIRDGAERNLGLIEEAHGREQQYVST